MSALLLLARVVRAAYASVVLVAAGVATALWVARIPDDWVYASVPSLAPGALVSALTGVALAALFAMPRLEALEATACRAMWPWRAGLSLVAGIGAAAIACLAALVARSPWHVSPLLSSAVAVSMVSFALTVVARPAIAALLPVGYVLSCYYGSMGRQWWDIVFHEPTVRRYVVLLLVSAAGAAVFAVRGARMHPPEEEL